nr:hypothetical protein Iba_chr14aCG19930 [Ipomoea batatas]GMD88906.1 hypothetical protein Iba_chr14cCG11620 [Ipomoea batatas]GMD91341.1 hypothetical protein Iba_chr14dCG18430 [Ipomoea batatas]
MEKIQMILDDPKVVETPKISDSREADNGFTSCDEGGDRRSQTTSAVAEKPMIRRRRSLRRGYNSGAGSSRRIIHDQVNKYGRRSIQIRIVWRIESNRAPIWKYKRLDNCVSTFWWRCKCC